MTTFTEPGILKKSNREFLTEMTARNLEASLRDALYRIREDYNNQCRTLAAKRQTLDTEYARINGELQKRIGELA